MKQRILKFITLMLTIIIVCAAVVGYVELQNINARKWESKAIVAQVRADIVLAQAQLTINKAVAFQLYTNSVLLLVLTMAPLCLAIVLISVVIYQWLNSNERLQKYYTDS